MNCKKYISIVCAFLLAFTAYSQDFKSEEEMKERAEELFEEGSYSKAMPLYSQLLSLYPNDPNYNYKFGTSLLYAEKDKEKPLKYLQFAAARPNVDSKVHYHLGKCYHLNYQFDRAIEAYNKYRSNSSEKEQEELQVKRQIEMCENGKSLLRNTTSLVVMQKRFLSESDFYRAYDLDKRFGGRLIKKPDEFKSSADKKQDEESVMFLESLDADIVYFSSYGKKGENGKDIFFKNRLPNGEWGKPISIGSPINTPYDEDFPFYDPQRQVMYFASKGHNSMGGYDIFKSYYNEDEGNFGSPVNLDFAISTPDDDLLYVVDYEEKTAFFASKRAASNGEMGIYQIRIERVPVNRSIIKGAFIAESTKSATITVKDADSGEEKGVYNTNPNTGNYLMNLPNGGKFDFIIERDGNPIAFTGTVEIPERDETSPLKQELILKIDDQGYEMLVIKNLFDEKVDESTVYSPEFLKQQASLDVNKGEYEELLAADSAQVLADNTESNSIENTENENNENEIVEIENISNEEIVDMAFKDAETLQQEADSARQKADLVMAVASDKGKEAKEVQAAADALWEEANAMEEGAEKDAAIKEANQMKKAAITANKEALFAYNLANNLDEDASNKQEEATTTLRIAEEVKAAINSESTDESVEKLSELQAFLQAEKKASAIETTYTSSKAKAELKRAEANKQAEKVAEFEDEAEKTKEEIAYLKKQKEDTKDNDIQAELALQIDELEAALDETKNLKKQAQRESEQLNLEADALESEVAFVDNLDEVMQSSNTSSLTDEEKEELAQEMSERENSVEQSEEEYLAQVNSAENNNETVTNENVTVIVSPEEAINKLNETQTEYENNLASTESTDDELERQNAKLELHNETAQKADALIADLEIAKQTADKKQLKEIEKAQKEARELKTEQEELAIKSQTKVDELLAEQTELATNETESNTTNTSNESAASNELITSSYTESFNKKMKETQGIDNQLDRTIARAEVDEEWLEFIDNETTELRQTANTQSGEEKVETEKRIELLEQLAEQKSNEIEQLYKQANSLSDGEEVEELAYANTNTTEIAENQSNEQAGTTTETEVENNNETAENLSAEQAGTTEIETNENTEVAAENYMEANEQQVQELINSSDAGSLENELARVEVYRKWANDIDAEIAELTEEKENTKKKKEQKELQERIEELQTLAAEKRLLAEESSEYAQDLQEAANTETAENSNPNTNSTSKNGEPTSAYTEEFMDETLAAREIEDTQLRTEKLIDINERWASKIKLEKEALQVQYDALEEGEDKDQAGERLAQLNELQAEKKQEIATLEEEQLVANNDNTEAEITENTSTEQVDNENNEVAANETETVENSTENNEVVNNETTNETDNETNNTEVTDNQSTEQQNNTVTNTETNVQESNADLLEGEEMLSNQAYIDAEVAGNDVLDYQEQADDYRSQAEAAKKKKDKEALLAEAEKFEQSAAYAKAEQKRLEENAAAIERAERRALVVYESEGVMESEAQYEKAEQLEEEANELAAQAAQEKTDAEAIKKKKDREAALSDARFTEEQAMAKKQEADNAYSLAEDMESAENNVLELAEQRSINQAEMPEFEENLDEVETAFVKNSDEFKEYAKADFQAKKMYRKAQVYYEESEEVANEANLQQELADNLRISAENETDETAKEEMLKKATEFENQSKLRLVTSYSLKQIGKQNEEEANKFKRTAEENLLALNNKVEEQFGYTADNVKTTTIEYDNNSTENNNENEIVENTTKTETENNNTNTENETAENNITEDDTETNTTENIETAENTSNTSNTVEEAIDEVPDVLETEEIFQKTESKTSVYNSSRPIPKVNKTPAGLVFKVQVGAFRNPIPQDLFKGFAPIGAEDVGNGITRYTAGYFKGFEKANNAKNDIRSVGYSDAFVVAYLNGKRISITEARAMIESGEATETLAENSTNNEAENTNTVTENSTANENNTAANETETNEVVENTSIEKADTETEATETNNSITEQPTNDKPVQNVEEVEGTFFTIQVGVYSKQVNPADLYNLQPLNIEQTASGLYRYTSGVFRTLETAQSAKDRIRSIGISDAFITAYSNGKRVTVAEAKTALGAGEEPVKEQDPIDIIETPKPNIEFRVQIGPYETEVPVGDARLLLQMSSKGVKKMENDEGYVVYTIGKFTTYEEAYDLKNEITEEGVFTAIEVAFSNDKKIEIEEAIELTE